MTPHSRSAALAALLLLATPAAGDVLETRDGRLLEGAWRGGTQQAIRFEVGGAIQVIPVSEVLALTFESTPAAAAEAAASAKPAPATTAAPAPTPMAAPAKPAGPRVIAVPAGTRLRARMVDTVDPRRTAVGDRFAAVLDGDLAVEGVVIAPARTKVYGSVTDARNTGPVPARLKLELNELMIGGQLVAIVTGTQQPMEPEPAAGEASPAKAAPAPSVARIPGGTLLEFRLLQPLRIEIP